ncbi:MAG: GTP-binding protein [Patescibacteria group bacterium]|nr:GTP-binding protein [Patescibacteria group bacterium]
MNNIRNFVIIAHIDSGKSTLADRLLETTGTVAMRTMRPQYLDQLDLERERGITIKMAPVRMNYRLGILNKKSGIENSVIEGSSSHATFDMPHSSNSEYILNLIDTPGHSDFSYEVSRALEAVEGAVLLVDGTKGIQAQTLANLRAARRSKLTIIGAVNKIDVASVAVESVVSSVAELLGVAHEDILKISAKTGEGVEELLQKVTTHIPPPRTDVHLGGIGVSRALIFDSFYDDHKGVVAFVRVFGGALRAGEEITCAATHGKIRIKEVGRFAPKLTPCEILEEGEIGYVATGLKEPTLVKIGDTIIGSQSADGTRRTVDAKSLALPGYREPQPVVFISFYPDGDSKFEDLERALARLKLNDAALYFEPDSNEALGRGFKVGFLGQLHFEIAASRLTREFNLSFLTSFPSIAYKVKEGLTTRIITQPQDFPLKPDKVWEPVIKLEIVMPPAYLNQVLGLQHVFEFSVDEIQNLGVHLALTAHMPLRELIRDFDDRLKSASAGFASFSYELAGEVESDVEKLEILLAGEMIPALTRIVIRASAEHEARQTVERLKNVLPQQQFTQAIQARVEGRILARETVPAMKKSLGNFGKNGGDRTRKMKLWKKQQEGKKKLLSMARVNLSPEVFREILKK